MKNKSKKKIFIFVLIIFVIFVAIAAFFCFRKNEPKNDIFNVEDIPRLDIKLEKSDDYKSRKYVSANFKLEDENFSGKIKTRGNSTRYVAEKYNAPYPYKIKFDEKKNPLNLGEAKSFVLLPNFIDASAIRQFFHLNFASFYLDDWSPKAKYVELYINEKYSGLYLFAESISVTKSRLNYLNDFGFIVEMDIQGKNKITTSTYIEEKSFAIDYQVDSDVAKRHNYTNEEKINVAFELKDPDSFSEIDNEHKNYILNSVENLYKNIDEDSFLRYFLLEEIFGNYSVGYGSVYYWNDGEKMHAGPFWDADRIATSDTSIGFLNDGDSTVNPVYKNLMKNPEFKEKIKNEFKNFYDKKEEFFKILENLKNNKTLKDAWQKNEDLYLRLSREDLKEHFLGSENLESRKTFEEQVNFIIDFYKSRLDWIYNNLENWE